MTEDELILAHGGAPLTETELVLATLTNEELADAGRYMGHMLDRWLESRRIAERNGRDELLEIGYHGTDGPVHAIRALDVALVREMAIRGGAAPWDARQSSEGHPARALITYYRERLELNPDLMEIPRLSAAGVLERVCPGCDEAKPLTVAFWRWLGSSMDLFCRACREAGEKEAIARLRDTLLDDEDRRRSAEGPSTDRALAASSAEDVELEPEVAL